MTPLFKPFFGCPADRDGNCDFPDLPLYPGGHSVVMWDDFEHQPPHRPIDGSDLARVLHEDMFWKRSAYPPLELFALGPARQEKIEFAGRLRAHMTYAERALWIRLRRRQLEWRVFPQVVILGWIVDFYVPGSRLAIEVDAKTTHDVEADAVRDAAMAREGIRVLRFHNDQAHGDDLDEIVREIKAAM